MKYTELLSPTEKEISESIALGNSMKEIAADRYRSVETVKTHIKNICTKWKARGVVDITRIYTLENADKFKLMIVALFLGIQTLCVLPDYDADLKRKRITIMRTRVTRTKNK